MRWIAALLMHRRRLIVVFVAFEILLALAIPFLLIEGYHTLLDSRTGTFVEEPTRTDPGWGALVDPTEVVGLVEVDQGAVTGLTLLVHNPEAASAGSAILVPGTLEIDGSALSARTPSDAVAALAAALRIDIRRTEVLDVEGWTRLLGETTYTIDNPDPVPGAGDGAGGEVVVPVGSVSVDASLASAFVGRPAAGAVPLSVLPRRHLWWQAVLAQPPTGGGQLAIDLAALDGARSQVIDLPLAQSDPVARHDPAAVEALIRDVVAFPAGSVPGDRLRVRLVDRTGVADLEDIAAAVAGQGLEVVEIANAGLFDDGPTEIVAPVSLVGADLEVLPGELDELVRAVGLQQVTVDDEPTDELVVTVVIGNDFDLSGLY